VPGTWEGAHLWAPNVVPYRGGFLMAYTGVNSCLSQDIGLACSHDLFHWERFAPNPISPCKGKSWSFWREDGIASCRDPHLLSEGGRLYMAYTANTALGEACVALASTEDLRHWEDHGPLIRGPSDGYEPDIGGGHKQGSLESPNLFSSGGKWYLQFMFRRNGCDTTNWIVESDTMFRFSWENAREFWPGAYTVEVVKRKGNRMLLACAGPIRFGEADFGEALPKGRFIRSREELEAWNK
jgi:sucrose-6-phosphate hydrolase SacC (GH32 family)